MRESGRQRQGRVTDDDDDQQMDCSFRFFQERES